MKGMTFNRCKDLIVGIGFLAFALLYASQIPAIRVSAVAQINSRFFPLILFWFMMIEAAVQTVLGFRHLKAPVDPDADKKQERIDVKCVVLTFLLTLAYVIVLEPVGFLISSILYLVLQMVVLCPKDEIRPVRFCIIAVAASAAIYFIFRNGLNLMLPAGILTGIL